MAVKGIISFIGLASYCLLLILMIVRNFNAVRKVQKSKDFLSVIANCIYDTRNPAFFVAVLNCFFCICTNIVYVAFDRGLIFNILQQGVVTSWLISLFRHVICIFDPFQRVIDSKRLSMMSSWIYLTLTVVCIAISVLSGVGITPGIYSHANSVNIFFMGVAAFQVCVCLRAAQYFMEFYMCCSRGLQCRVKDAPSNEQKLHLTLLAKIKKNTIGGKVEVAELMPSVDTGCVRSLVMQKVMLERLLGLCVIAGVFNLYKMFWSASLTGCFFHAKCAPNVPNSNIEHASQNLSYWVPDFMGLLYWFFFLLNPLSVHLQTSAEKRHTQFVEAKSRNVIQSSGSINLGFVYKGDSSRASEPSIEMFDSKNPLNVAADVEVKPDLRDLKRLSKKSKQKSRINIFGPSNEESEASNTGVTPSLLKNFSSSSDCRELHLSLNEMVLVDQRIGLPVTSLFAGRDTFVVMSVCGLSTNDFKRKRTSGVMARLSDRFRSVSRGSKLFGAGASASLYDENEDDGLFQEMARSDCRINEANPDFIVSFIVPVIEDDDSTENVKWRFDIYNATTVDPSFRSDLAVLDEQKLVGVLYVNNCDLSQKSRPRQNSWQQTSDSPDSDDELDQLATSSGSGGALVIHRKIIVANYGDNFVRLGGVGIIRTRTICPFSQLIAELGVVNSMRHPHAKTIAAANATAVATELTSTRERKSSKDILQSVTPRKNSSDGPEVDNSHEVLMRAFSFNASVAKNDERRREIRVVEEMVESPYAFQVPLAYMKCLLVERYMEMDVLMNRFGLHDVAPDYFGDDWQREIIASLQRSLMELKESMRDYSNSTSTFKPSAKKSDFGLRYIPINLHMHVMTMAGTEKIVDKTTGATSLADYESSYICDFMTVGAFAAHTKKFKSGGLWHMMTAFDSRLEKITKGQVTAPGDFRVPDEVWNTESLLDLPAEKKLFHLALDARERLDICLAQCLAAVVTGFVSRVQLMSPEALERIATVGLLFQFESLLSTQGSELGMLADMYCTIRCLNRVHLKIHEDRADAAAGERISRRMSSTGPEASVSIYWGNAEGCADQCLIVDMGFFPDWFKRLPKIIQDGKTIPVVPVMFSVGINELQSYAETVNGKKASALQDIINMENLERIENYCSLVIRLEKGEFDASNASTDDYGTSNFSSNIQHASESDFGIDKRNSKELPIPSSPSPDPSRKDSPIVNDQSLQESVVETFSKLDRDGGNLIGRRRQAINLTATAIALKANGSRRRLSSIMVPSVATLASSSGSAEHECVDPDRSGGSGSSSHVGEHSTKSPFATPPSPNGRPAPMLKKNSLVKIWDVVEDDSDDESDDGDTLGSPSTKLRSKEKSSEDVICKAHAPTAAKDSPFDHMLDEDAEDAIIAIDIERAINERYRETMRETETHDRTISLSQFVTSVIPSRDRERKESSVLPSIFNPNALVQGPRRRAPSIAQRLMSFVSSPKTSTVSVQHSTEDPSVVFGEDDLDNSMELGLAGSLYQRDQSIAPGISSPPLKAGNSTSPAYLRDRLAIRESSFLHPGMAPPVDTNPSLDACASDFEGRILRLLTHLSNIVKASNGAGGKPYQILTTSAKLTRALDGVRSTSCKSAKDRTGMSVTLEEASLVKDVYGITAVETKDLLDTLRVHGLRLENAKKNVGKARFAFNGIQRRFLPTAYAPPVSVIGNVSS